MLWNSAITIIDFSYFETFVEFLLFDFYNTVAGHDVMEVLMIAEMGSWDLEQKVQNMKNWIWTIGHMFEQDKTPSCLHLCMPIICVVTQKAAEDYSRFPVGPSY